MTYLRRSFSVLVGLLTLVSSSRAVCQWVQTNGTGNAIIQCITASGSTVLAGSNSDGVFRSTDGGLSWSSANNGLADTDVHALALIGTTLLAGTANGVFASTDNGADWSATRLTHGQISAFLLIGEILFAATDGYGVLRSTDSGWNWTDVNTGLPVLFTYALARMNTNLFVGTGYRGAGVYRSTDSGSHWTAVNNGLVNAYVWSLFSTKGNLFAGTDGGVFLTTDGGAKWSETALKNTLVHGFAESGNYLFSSAWEDGILLSADHGISWTAIDSGLYNTNTLAVGVSGDYLFAGSSGSGIYRRSIKEVISRSGVQATPSSAAMYLQSYPNPFPRSTTIHLTLPARAFTQITIVNLLGNPVTQLFSGELEAGEHSFVWDAKDAPPGTYFCIIRDGVASIPHHTALVLAR